MIDGYPWGEDRLGFSCHTHPQVTCAIRSPGEDQRLPRSEQHTTGPGGEGAIRTSATAVSERRLSTALGLKMLEMAVKRDDRPLGAMTTNQYYSVQPSAPDMTPRRRQAAMGKESTRLVTEEKGLALPLVGGPTRL